MFQTFHRQMIKIRKFEKLTFIQYNAMAATLQSNYMTRRLEFSSKLEYRDRRLIEIVQMLQ